MTEKEKKSRRKASRKHYRNHKKKCKEWQRNNYKENKSYYADCHLKERYGMSLDDYNDMFILQNGCCALCGKHQSELSRKLFVDHDHETGKIRKLICAKCNLMVGYIETNTNLAKRIFKYLKENK